LTTQPFDDSTIQPFDDLTIQPEVNSVPQNYAG
jgi:hypothetical protein